jgi:hypothetical protein
MSKHGRASCGEDEPWSWEMFKLRQLRITGSTYSKHFPWER